MLRRVALALKLANSIPSQPPCFVPSFTSPPCRFIPSLHSSTCIRYMAVFSASHVASNDRKRAANQHIPPATPPEQLPECHPTASPPAAPKPRHLSPRDAVVGWFLEIPGNQDIVKRLKASPDHLEYFLDPRKLHGILYALASSKAPGFALKALHVARLLGSPADLSAYETIAYRLGALKEWDLLLHAVSAAIHDTRKTTGALLDWRARALLETANFTELNRIFVHFQANNLIASRRTWHLVLSGYIRNHDLAGARECIRDMAAAGFPSDHSTHALLGTLYPTIGPDEQVKERSIDALPHIPDPTATAMMNSQMMLRLRIHDLDEVSRLLSAFDQSKVGPLSLMLAASRTQRDDNTQNKGVDDSSFPVVVAPDATTFAMFIDYFADLHELPRCLAIFDHMLAVGIAPAPRAITSLIRAYFSVDHGGAAVRLVAAMCEPQTISPKTLQDLPSPDGYDLLFDAAGIQPTRQIFNCLLRAVLQTNGTAGGRAVLALMGTNGVKPDSKSAEIIASHSSKVERVQPRFVMRMIRRFSPRVTLQEAHVVLASTLRIQKFIVHGMGWDHVAAKFSPVRTQAVQPYPEDFVSHSQDTFDPLAGIVLPSHLGQRGTFRAMEHSLTARGVKSDQATIALRIRHEAVIRGDMDAATDVFQTMMSRGLHPNKYHYSALMEGFANRGDFESAVEAMKAAARASFEPNVLMFTILIVGYGRRKKPDMALQIFQRMIDAGIKPDVPAIDAVASAFFVVGAYTMCWRVLTELWKHISPLPPDIDQTSLQSAVIYFRSLHKKQQGLKKTSKEFRMAVIKDVKRLQREWEKARARVLASQSSKHIHTEHRSKKH